MSKPKKSGSNRHGAFTFDDDTMALVEKVVEQTPDDNLMALFDPSCGFGYFGIPGPLLKAQLASGRDGKRYTARARDFGRGVVGHVYKVWLPSQLARLQRLVEENEAREAHDREESSSDAGLDGLAEAVAEEAMNGDE